MQSRTCVITGSLPREERATSEPRVSDQFEPILLSAEPGPFPLSGDVRRDPIAQGHDGEDGVEPAVGDMETAVSEEQIADIVHLAVAVGHGRFRVIPHAAGARLM